MHELEREGEALPVAQFTKNLGVAYLLWCAGFIGLAGLHRIYMGKPASGLLWLFTGGLCGLGQLADVAFMPRMLADAQAGRGW